MEIRMRIRQGKTIQRKLPRPGQIDGVCYDLPPGRIFLAAAVYGIVALRVQEPIALSMFWYCAMAARKE